MMLKFNWVQNYFQHRILVFLSGAGNIAFWILLQQNTWKLSETNSVRAVRPARLGSARYGLSRLDSARFVRFDSVRSRPAHSARLGSASSCSSGRPHNCSCVSFAALNRRVSHKHPPARAFIPLSLCLGLRTQGHSRATARHQGQTARHSIVRRN